MIVGNLASAVAMLCVCGRSVTVNAHTTTYMWVRCSICTVLVGLFPFERQHILCDILTFVAPVFFMFSSGKMRWASVSVHPSCQKYGKGGQGRKILRLPWHVPRFLAARPSGLKMTTWVRFIACTALFVLLRDAKWFVVGYVICCGPFSFDNKAFIQLSFFATSFHANLIN